MPDFYADSVESARLAYGAMPSAPVERLPDPIMLITEKYDPVEQCFLLVARFYRHQPVRSDDGYHVLIYKIRNESFTCESDFEGAKKYALELFVKEFEHWQDENNVNWVKREGAWVYIPTKNKECRTINP